MLEKFFKDLVIPDIRGRIQLNVVVYGSPKGIPARFFAGIIPAILLAKKFIAQEKDVCIRVFNPITIASFCNGWQNGEDKERQNKKAITLAEKFLEKQGIPFFFDPSLPVSDEMMKALQPLEEAIRNEPTLRGTLKRLETSGLRYGGGIGEKQSALYAVAHPFGWQDLWHQSLWLSKPAMGTTVINIMSEAEKPFSTVRRFLVERYTGIGNLDSKTTSTWMAKGVQWSL